MTASARLRRCHMHFFRDRYNGLFKLPWWMWLPSISPWPIILVDRRWIDSIRHALKICQSNVTNGRNAKK